MSQQAAEAQVNWLRKGVFAPVTEEVTAFDLPVTGRIPPESNGRYLRNGPNFKSGIDDNKYHWFRGSGMVLPDMQARYGIGDDLGACLFSLLTRLLDLCWNASLVTVPKPSPCSIISKVGVHLESLEILLCQQFK